MLIFRYECDNPSISPSSLRVLPSIIEKPVPPAELMRRVANLLERG